MYVSYYVNYSNVCNKNLPFSECPLHTQMFKYPSVFNWTATYRRDSTIVAPYEYWQYYNNKVRLVFKNTINCGSKFITEESLI